MKWSSRYVWLVPGLCVGLLMLLGPKGALAAPQDPAPVSEPAPAAAPVPEPATTLAPATVLAPAVAPAPAPSKGDAFSSGSKRLTVIVGNGYAFENSYLLIGVGAAYFIANGLALGLDYEYWTGADPTITKISPRLDYVLNTRGKIKPYAGVFYRRTMVEGLDDLDSAGGRAGLYLMSGKGLYVGAGLVYESYASCDTAIYSSCSDTYSEIIIAFSF